MQVASSTYTDIVVFSCWPKLKVSSNTLERGFLEKPRTLTPLLESVQCTEVATNEGRSGDSCPEYCVWLQMRLQSRLAVLCVSAKVLELVRVH